MPMTKSNLKNILTAVRDIINRSRIAYKDYLGEETVTETKVLVEGTLSEQGTLTLKDPSFTRFVVGEGYEVTIDGATQTLTAISDGNVEGITNAIDLVNPGENFFAVVINLENGQPVCKAGGTYVGKTISISQTKTTTTKKYDIKKVPQELIPDTIARSDDVANVETKADDAFNKATNAQAAADNAQAAADNAQAAAENAQAAAKNAQTTAENAQTTAESAQTAADTAQAAADGCVKTNNAGSFGIHIDDNSHFIGSNVTGKTYYYFRQNSVADTPITLSIGEDGGSALDISVTRSTVKIEPPGYMNTQADIEIASRVSGTKPQITGLGGITMYSSTAGSTKKFKITVDDSGTISATEVT